MKFCVFADYHLHQFKEFAKPKSFHVNGKQYESTDRLEDHINTLRSIFQIADEQGANHILFLGDFFEERKRVPTLIMNLALNVLREQFDKYPHMKMYMLVGNHDMADEHHQAEHSLESFKAFPEITVLDMFEPVDVEEARLFPVPYTNDTGYAKKKIEEYSLTDTDKSRLLLGHLGVEGSYTGNRNHKLEGAFMVGNLIPDLFNFVLLGHFHVRQELQPNVIYAGNPLHTSFGDSEQDKGCYILDTEQDSLTFHAIPNKKFLTITELTKDTEELAKNNYTRFILPEDQAQLVSNYQDDNDTVRVEVEKTYKSETRIDIDVQSDEAQVVSAYVREFYDKETEQEALDVLKEVRP